MGLESIELKNKGMLQDTSISQSVQEFAFRNYNIRIQALEDNTLFSVTNIKGPKLLNIKIEQPQESNINSDSIYGYNYADNYADNQYNNIQENPTIKLEGVILGKCVTKDFLILFTHSDKDCIFRIDYNDSFIGDRDTIVVRLLYKGDLNFNTNYPIETLFFYENSKVQKVYFTDNYNMPRVINIITPSEISGQLYKDFKSYEVWDADRFEFFNKLNSIPKLKIKKNYSTVSELPAGTIQYFISYYNYNGSETMIANASSVFTIDFKNRGAKADESGMCAFNIKLYNLDNNFDYVRLYSAVRTSKEGPLTVKIVGDYQLNADTQTIDILDTGINQETLSPEQLFFIGGTPFVAGTIAYKDNTLFFGNLKTTLPKIPKEIEDVIAKCIDKVVEPDDEHYWARNINFNFKGFPNTPTEFNNNYTYKLQTSNSSKDYKTFKRGEIYRFGIQFQTALGEWTSVIWLGDKMCDTSQKIDTKNKQIFLNNATYNIPPELSLLCRKAGFKNYRIVIADAETQNGRSILAQGLVCPTLFTPGQRAKNSPYALSSWVMRPRQGNIACHHFEPLQAAEEEKGAELLSYQLVGNSIETEDNINIWNDGEYTTPYIPYNDQDASRKPTWLVTLMSIDSNDICTRTVKFKASMEEAEKSFWGIKDGEYDLVYDAYTKDYFKMKNGGLEAFREDMVKSFIENGCPIDWIPSLDALLELQKVIHKEKWKEAFIWIAAIVIIVIAIVIAVFSAGIAASASAALIWSAISLVGAAAAATLTGSAMAIESFKTEYGLSKEDYNEIVKNLEGLENWQKEFLLNGFWAYEKGNTKVFEGGDAPTKDNPTPIAPLPKFLKPENFDKLNGTVEKKAVHLISIKQIPDTSDYSSLIKKQWNEYYIDESIVSFHTPFAENLGINSTDANFRIVGIAPIHNTYSDFDLKISNQYSVDEHNIYDNVITERNTTTLLTSDFLYYGPDKLFGVLDTEQEEQNPESTDSTLIEIKDANASNALIKYSESKYKVFMFDKSGSILGADGNTILKEGFSGTPSEIIDKTFYNHQFSNNSNFLPIKDFIEYRPSTIEVFNADNSIISYNQAKKHRLYAGNYDNLIVETKTDPNSAQGTQKGLGVFRINNRDPEKKVLASPYIQSSVRMQYNSTPHLIFDLSDKNPGNKSILPYFDTIEKYKGLSTRKTTLGGKWGDGNGLYNFTRDCWTSQDEYYYRDCYFIDYSKTDKELLYNRKTKTFIPMFDIRAYKSLIFHIDILNRNISDGSVLYNLLFNKAHNQYFDDQAKNYTLFKNYLLNQYKSLSAEPNYISGSHYKKVIDYYKSIAEDFYKLNPNQITPIRAEELLIDLKEVRTELEQLKGQYNSTINELYKGVDINTVLSLYLSNVEKWEAYRFAKNPDKGIIIGVEVLPEEYILSEHKKWFEFTELVPTVTVQKAKAKTQSQKPWEVFNSSIKNMPGYVKYYKLKISGGNLKEGIFTNLIMEESTHSDNEIYIIKNYKSPYRYRFSHRHGLEQHWDFPIRYNTPIIYNSNILEHDSNNNILPFLFIGELYKDIKHKELYGGFDKAQINNLIWYPASAITPIDKDVEIMEGDTYFQRWDCLKTYPSTDENFENKVVDITSFMLETHFNLDARVDKNRGTFNLMTRPSNFNLFNPVYDFKNNIFTYTTKQNNLDSVEYKNQFIWSLSKNYLARVDSWTNVSFSNIANCVYPITKLVNWNNQMIALTEHSIEMINFNAKNLLPSDNGEVIELTNSGKVDGTIRMSHPYGTYNKSVLETEAGLYFIDDNEKSIIRWTQKGPEKLGIGSIDSWLKNNIIQGTYSSNNGLAFHFEYDPIHKDVYIVNDVICLIYNETLNSFTSFVDYQNTNLLFDFKGNIYSLTNDCQLYRMFDGEYNTTYGGKPINYELHYRVCPSPLSDKTFTNIEFISDCGVEGVNGVKTHTQPFNYIQVFNEYQDTGKAPLKYDRHSLSNLKQKFRVWRADIPRDNNSKWGRDRIRNPWINLIIGRDNSDGNKEKMVLHNLNVKYLN